MRLFFHGVGPEYDFSRRSKIALIRIAILLSLCFLTLFGIDALRGGNTVLGRVDLSAAVILFCFDRLCLTIRYFSLVRAVALGLYFVLFLYLTISGGFHASGYLWAFLLPMYAVFLWGFRKGTLVNLAYLSAVMVYFFFGFPVSSSQYSLDLKLRFCSTFFTLTILAIFLDYFLTKMREDVHNKNRALESALRDLEREQKNVLRSEKERKVLEEQLLQAQKMEAIGRLAGGIAHDFNNKLAAIMGSTDLIRQHLAPGDERFGRYLGTIASTARKSADLTAKLLAFARQGNYVISRVNVHDMVQDVIRMLKMSLESDGVSIVERLRAEPAVVMGDLAQLQNALINLAVNARNAMPEGGTLTFASTTIELAGGQEPALEPGRYVQLSISDTGVGIDDEKKKRLFEPFFSAQPFGQRVGLGLASAYGTIKSHNGSIRVESALGRGTTFVLVLPCAPVDHADAPEEAPARQIPAGGCILVVDDEEQIRALTKEMLELFGYSVLTAEDGLAAIDIYKERHRDISLVLLDVVMPRLGGHGCFTELKKINPRVKVIVSTGYSIEGEATKIMDNGAAAFIQKPYNMRDLKQLLLKTA